MNTDNPTLQALIFDVDGTLADTERDGHRVAFNAAFDEFGINWDWSVGTYGELLAVTGGKERMKYFYAKYPAAQQISDKSKQCMDELIPEIHKAKTKHYTDLLATGAIPLRPGVERLLNEARERGYRLAIASTTRAENVTGLLQHTLGTESIDWFEVIAVGDIVPAKKTGAGYLSVRAATNAIGRKLVPGIRRLCEWNSIVTRYKFGNHCYSQRLHCRS